MDDIELKFRLLWKAPYITLWDGWQCHPMGGWTVSSVTPWEGGQLAVSPHGRVDG